MNVERLQEICRGNENSNPLWLENPEEKVELLNRVTYDAQEVALDWILIMGPEWLTQENITLLNNLSEMIEVVLPETLEDEEDELEADAGLEKASTENPRKRFNTPEKITKILAILANLYELKTKILDLQTKKRLLANAYNLMFGNCSVNLEPFITLDDVEGPLTAEHLSQICLVRIPPQPTRSFIYRYALKLRSAGLQSHLTYPRNPERIDSIYKNDGIADVEAGLRAGATPQGVISDPLTGVETKVQDIHRPTPDLVDFSFANYLLNVRRALIDPKLFEEFDLQTLNYSDNYILLISFKAALDKFRAKYLKMSRGQLTTRWLVGKEKLAAYNALLGAYNLALANGNFDILTFAIKQNAKHLGLNRFINFNFLKSDLAKFCDQWTDEHKTFVIDSPQSTVAALVQNVNSRPQQRPGYLLTVDDLHVAMKDIAQEYELSRAASPDTTPKLTFLPVWKASQLGDFNEMASRIRDRGPQSYVGIQNLDNSHYILYFIHKWPSGKMAVVLIDPLGNDFSYRKRAFERLFPDSEVISLNIRQQFNGTDCGVATFKTMDDIAKGLSGGAPPFIKLVGDHIEIFPLNLTMNADNTDKHDTPEDAASHFVSCREKLEEKLLLKNKFVAFGFGSSDDDEEDLGYYYLELEENDGQSYDFATAKLEFEKHANNVLLEFLGSREYKTVVATANRTINILEYQNELTLKFLDFKRHSREYRTYNDNTNRLNERLPGALENFINESIYKNFFMPLVLKELEQTFKTLNRISSPQAVRKVERLFDQLQPPAAKAEDKPVLMRASQQEQAIIYLIKAYHSNHVGVFEKLLSYITDTELLGKPREELGGLSLLAHACKHNKLAHLQALLNRNQALILEFKLKKPIINKDSALMEFAIDGSTVTLADVAVQKGHAELISALFLAIPAVEAAPAEEVIPAAEAAPVEEVSTRERVAKGLVPFFASKEVNYGALDAVLLHLQDNDDSLNALYGEETLLTRACLLGNLEAVQSLIAKKVNLEQANSNGHIPLQIACERDNNEIVKALWDAMKETHADNLNNLKVTATGWLQQALDNKKKTVVYTLAGVIGRPDINDFYADELDALIDGGFIDDSTIKQWEDADLLGYLDENFQAGAFKSLVEKAINQNQPALTKRLLAIFAAKGREALTAAMPSLLLTAYTKNNTAIFGELLDYVTDFNIEGLNLQVAHNFDPTLNGRHTFLSAACLQERNEIVDLLVKKGDLDVSVAGDGQSPIYWAVMNKRNVAANLLLDRLAQQSLVDLRTAIRGNDLLYRAYFNNNKTLFESILAKASDLNLPGLNVIHPSLGKTFFEDNATRYQHSYSKLLFEKGVTLTSKHLMQFDNFYRTVLVATSQLSDKTKQAQITSLLEPIINTRDLNQKQKLCDEAIEGIQDRKFKELFRELKGEIGAFQIRLNNQEKQHTGFSELHALCRDGSTIQGHHLADTCCEAGAKQESLEGKTALHYAVSRQEQPNQTLFTVQKLLQHEEFKSCLDLVDYDGRLPLHYACKKGLEQVAGHLLKGNAILPAIADTEKRTPLHYACMTGKEVLVSKIMNGRNVTNINDRDKFGATPLHYAASHNKAGMIAELIAKGANCNVVDNEGNTPLHVLCQKGDLASLRALMKAPDFYGALLIKNKAKHTPLDELKNNVSPEAARTINAFLAPLMRLVQKKADLNNNNDPLATAKKGAIDTLLNDLVQNTDEAAQRNVLTQHITTDAVNPLFTPRRGRCFWKVSNPADTATAKDVAALQQAVAVGVEEAVQAVEEIQVVQAVGA